MTDSLTQLQDWAAPLLQQLDGKERRTLAKELGTELRRSQRERIRAQQNADGSNYAPRKAQQKSGHIKRKAMFVKLRQARYLKARTRSDEVTVGFFGQVANLARVHQYGLRDRTRKDGPQVQYEQRELLGFSDADLEMIEEKLLQHLAG